MLQSFMKTGSTSKMTSPYYKTTIVEHEVAETSVGTERHWFKVIGKTDVYSVWIEVENGKEIGISCDCKYSSNNNFGKPEDCKHKKECRFKLKQGGIL